MPEAEEVITDVARHATVFVRDLWQRHRKDGTQRNILALRDAAARLELLNAAVFGTGFPIRAAQAPAPPTFLTKLFRRREGPRVDIAIPATDGRHIWLPPRLDIEDRALALEWFRVMAVQQAMRAKRNAPRIHAGMQSPLERAVFALIEARAADIDIEQRLPGMRAALDAFRQSMLAMRPPLDDFPPYRRPLEELARTMLSPGHGLGRGTTAEDAAALARQLAAELGDAVQHVRRDARLLHKDYWTGELVLPSAAAAASAGGRQGQDDVDATPRSAKMTRRPDVREAPEDEDDEKQGAWMVQTSQPHEQAEDPVGMQRPTDRDESTAAEEFADALSELPEARLVSTPGRPKEVLLSEDAPASRAKTGMPESPAHAESRLWYPEWDYRAAAYREPGALVHLRPAAEGPQEWVDRTVESYRSMLDLIRRRFEMLRAERTRLRKQLDGEEIDIEAYTESIADFRAGLPMGQALYQTVRPARRDIAIVLLIDVSGSTDGWISADKRVIDVEREALLLVSIALQGMQAPYSILAFSGEGPKGVTVNSIKAFDEPYAETIARRIAALEPEHYTRAGAAIRHASAVLLGQPSRHRLLLLLSDGKPNDVDDYEGRYGVEDMRQAIAEARLQGINPFCLTIDRQASGYLPAIFGVHHYALLPKPELLPPALLEWMKRLVTM